MSIFQPIRYYHKTRLQYQPFTPTNMNTSPPSHPSFNQALKLWLKMGLLSSCRMEKRRKPFNFGLKMAVDYPK